MGEVSCLYVLPRKSLPCVVGLSVNATVYLLPFSQNELMLNECTTERVSSVSSRMRLVYFKMVLFEKNAVHRPNGVVGLPLNKITLLPSISDCI